MVHWGVVLKRKGLIPRRRFLILTDRPRLLYIEEETMREKGEIPWSAELQPELKEGRQFHIHTVSSFVEGVEWKEWSGVSCHAG